MGKLARPGPPTFKVERSLWRQGSGLVAGVDEVGRGPLAGPVAAGAVVLPPRARFPWLHCVRDSKQLGPTAREELAALIWRHALAAAVAFVPVWTIDRLGIAEAARLAMLQAVGDLSRRPQHLLIDAFRLPACSLPQTPIIEGDALSLSIACASIIAKVARDRVMEGEDAVFPGYAFADNKGYGTPFHLAALDRLGPCDLHRRSFAPVREMLMVPAAV
ncbi:MAG TPA: ribonuclease HII [Dehalococcoidia bacterium]|nr:ribonuclease HII [Dehalococcoidia bacterium]